jgi:peptidoglycan-N-acetylglucosamine deacetylase
VELYHLCFAFLKNYRQNYNVRKKSKKQQRKFFLRPLTVLLLIVNLFVIFAVIFCFIILNDPKQSVFPLLHRYQKSPSNYIQAKKEILANTLPLPEVIEHGKRDKKEVALTFDADMTYGMLNLLNNGSAKSWYNKPAIDYLNQENIKATIFFAGLWVKAYPKNAKEIAQNPLFEIGNHSFSHPAFTLNCFGLPFLPDGNDKNEVDNAQKIIIQTTGVIPELFRFPGGCYEKVDLDMVSRLGLTVVHWDTVAEDGLNENTQSIVDNVERNVQNGSIIVMHLNNGTLAPKTYFALLQIVPDLKRQGYNFVKVSDLLNKD